MTKNRSENSDYGFVSTKSGSGIVFDCFEYIFLSAKPKLHPDTNVAPSVLISFFVFMESFILFPKLIPPSF